MSSTYAQLYTRFNTWLRDSGDITFSQPEKEEFLNAAFNDAYVYSISRDASLTTVDLATSYTVPSGFLGITDIFVDFTNDGFGDRLSQDAWDEIDGKIYIAHFYKGIPGGKAIYIWGRKKLTTSDTIPTYLETYLLHLAMIEAMGMIVSQLATRFVKNKVTMAEAISAKRVHEAAVLELRKTLPNHKPVIQ